VSLQETQDGYVVPSTWTQVSIDDGTWGYVTAEATPLLPEGYSKQGDALVSSTVDDATGTATMIQADLDGNELQRVEVPLMETTEENQMAYLNAFAFGPDCLWLAQSRYTVLDETTGKTAAECQLEQWSYDGQCLQTLPLEETYGIDLEQDSLIALQLDPEGAPLLLTMEHLIFCDSQGGICNDIPSDLGEFCTDAQGLLYFHSMSDSMVYTLDWENHDLGASLFSTSNLGDQILPGGGDYDFLLNSDTQLWGVTLATGTITEILSWEDWSLANSVGGVTYVDEDTFLISVYSIITNNSQTLSLTRVPADQIPEKTVVRLAVGLSEATASFGGTWVDSVDSMVADAISQFNMASDTYRVEVETFSSNTELSRMLLTGDAPDLIYWSYVAWLDDPATPSMYAKRGYLTDLDTLLDADADLSQEDFIPSILALAREQTGGLYAIPLSYYFTTLTAQSDYLGGRTSWTISDMLEIAKTLPEDMDFWSYNSQNGILETLMEACLGDFVDELQGTCDFETQEFYDLLTLCRDYFPPETGEDYVPADQSLVQGGSSAGGLAFYVQEVLETAEASGQTIIGYPDAGDNGASIVFYDQMSVCALGQQQEGAWLFLRTLLGYDFQYNVRVLQSIRQDALQDRMDWHLTYNDSVTPEELQTAADMIYNATHLRDLNSSVLPIVEEEAAAFFNGDKTAQDVAKILNSRVSIYLGEQS
jgi:ABC-type glycerol-3-phosphate transport system substrate-binding protein